MVGAVLDERQTKLLAWKSYLTRYIMRLAEVVHAETGKPVADAQLEILLAIVHIDWAAKHARKVLGPHKVRSGLVAFNHASTVEYHPLGVVGVIGPWNYPVFTPIGSIAYALAAGNAVVFKPSEFTPAIGGWLVSSFAEVVPEFPVLQLVTGFGETGSHLARSGVDKIAFTGSTRTAKKVMAACAENLTPMVAECGGKDAMLVAADADLDSAADAAVWGALSNAGQTCVGVERIYVAQDVYHTFIEKLADRVSGLRPGDDREADYGPMTMPSQLEVIEQHIADAMAIRRARDRRRARQHPQALRRPGDPRRRAGDQRRRHRGDLRADHDGQAGRRPRRGRAARQRRPVRARRQRVLQEQEGRDAGRQVAAHRHGVGQLGADGAERAVAAVRRRGRVGVRPDSRRRRPARVHQGAVDHQAADEAEGRT